jgi:hypothetical protein
MKIVFIVATSAPQHGRNSRCDRRGTARGGPTKSTPAIPPIARRSNAIAWSSLAARSTWAAGVGEARAFIQAHLAQLAGRTGLALQ